MLHKLSTLTVLPAITKDLNTLTSLTGHEEGITNFSGNSGFCSELTPIGEAQHDSLAH